MHYKLRIKSSRQCEITNENAKQIGPRYIILPPKRGNWGDPSSYFSYRYAMPDGVMGGFIISVEIPTDG